MTPSSSAPEAIPPPIVDQAVAWVVKLRSGTVDDALHRACEAWRAADPLHERAWQELQAIEREFVLPLAPQVAFKTLETLERNRSVDRGRRRALELLGLGATGLAATWLVTGHAPSLPGAAAFGADYATATGERRSVALADGSHMLLNTATAVDVRYTAEARLVVLRRGEIFVATGKDDHAPSGRRPFRVATAQGRFEALGTRFVLRQEENQTRLRVEEGAVAMPAGSGTAVAPVGQEFVIDTAGPAVVTDSRFDLAGWVHGALVARQMRLAEFVAELSRYRPGWLRCDPAVANLRVSGVFQLDDTDRALEALGRTLPVKIERRTRYWVTVIPPSGS